MFWEPKIVERVINIPVETIKYKIVEVDKPRPHLAWDKEARETVLSLQHHPGFVILTDRLSNQAALLKAQLENTRFASKEDFEFVQSGIFWCKWLKQQVAAATTRASQTAVDAAKEDEEAFKELQASLIRVGDKGPQAQ